MYLTRKSEIYLFFAYPKQQPGTYIIAIAVQLPINYSQFQNAGRSESARDKLELSAGLL